MQSVLQHPSPHHYLFDRKYKMEKMKKDEKYEEDWVMLNKKIKGIEQECKVLPWEKLTRHDLNKNQTLSKGVNREGKVLTN